MEKKSTLDDLHFMHELFQQKNNDFRDMINNLKIGDVKDEKTFQKTKERIKNQVLLTPVLFESPKITDNRTEMRQRQITIVEVKFPFQGSAELFEYRPDSITFYDPTVYLPIGNSVNVEVIVEKLNKEEVLSIANKQIALTIGLINAINPQIEAWSKRMTTQIDDQLQEKRKELIDLYS